MSTKIVKLHVPMVVTLPIAYARAAERAADSLSSLLEDGLNENNVREAHVRLKALCKAEERLSQRAKSVLGIWD